LAQRLRDLRAEAEAAAPALPAGPTQLARAPRDLEHVLSVGYSDIRLSDFGRTQLDDNDIGEVKRIVSTFLQLLDTTDDTDSILIAATNVGTSLDHALFRRFDDVLELPGPTPGQAAELLSRLMRQWKEQLDEETLQAAIGLSFADIHAAVDDVRKEAILDGRTAPRPGGVRDMLLARSARLS
jgi:SpoVK/Ycf46/Vps4 family AAA+-type ATPase